MLRRADEKVPEYLLKREQARRKDRLIQGISLVLALGGIAGAGVLLGSLTHLRQELQLEIDPEVIGTLPPDIALMTQMSTLRALAIDVGFIRLEKLKEQGRFYELMQLSSWLCKLAPRYATVWQYAAWNAAYNISVCEYTPEARWLWVQNGIRLLRDEGIKYNPKAVGLYKDLAYIYWHKVGDILDDQHWRYKAELAVQMERVLGAKPPVLTEEEELNWFRPIAEAPRDFEQFLAEDAAAADLAAKLRELGLETDESLLEFVAQYLRPGVDLRSVLNQFADEQERNVLQRRVEVLTDEATAAARDRLLAALRAHVLRSQFKLNPQWMLSLMEKYGPIDWRTPFAHALYWSSWGDMKTKGQLNLNAADSMNTARFIFFALYHMIQHGRYVLEPDWNQPNESFLDMMPDPRFIDHLHQAYLDIGKEQDGEDPEFREGTSGPRYWVGHVNFLHTSIKDLFFEGDARSIAKAKKYYRYLQEFDVDPDTGEVKPQYVKPLEKFVMDDIYETLTTARNTTLFVSTFFNRSLKEISIGDAEAAMGYMEQAKKAYDQYMKDAKVDPNDRRKLEPLDQIYRDVVQVFMQAPYNSTYQKTQVWSSLDLEVRQDVYDALLPHFIELCERHDPPLDVNRAFPIPPDMDEARKRAAPRRDRDRDASEGTKDFSQ